MIKHIVLYRLKDRTNENAIALRDVFLSMKGKVDCLVDITAGVDFLREGRSFDVVLECVFNTKEDMNNYKSHPVHLPVVEYVKPRVECSHAVDYEY